MSSGGASVLDSPFLTISTLNGLLASVPAQDHTRRIQYLSAKLQLLSRALTATTGRAKSAPTESDERLIVLETTVELAREYLATGEIALAETQANQVRSSCVKESRSAALEQKLSGRFVGYHIEALGMLEELDTMRGRQSRAARWAAEREGLEAAQG